MLFLLQVEAKKRELAALTQEASLRLLHGAVGFAGSSVSVAAKSQWSFAPLS